METTYKLNVRELTDAFISSIQNVYPDRDIEITVREAFDETEYLCQSPENKKRLDNAVKKVERGENIVTFENIEQAIQCARERAEQ